MGYLWPIPELVYVGISRLQHCPIKSENCRASMNRAGKYNVLVFIAQVSH